MIHPCDPSYPLTIHVHVFVIYCGVGNVDYVEDEYAALPRRQHFIFYKSGENVLKKSVFEFVSRVDERVSGQTDRQMTDR
jgi:hypothetical protein